MKQRVRDLLLYAVTGVGIVGGAVLFGVSIPERFFPSRAWFVFICATAFLCLFVLKMYWQYRRSAKLWALLVLLLIVHIALYTIIFEHLPQFPTILFLFTVPVEIMLVAAIVKLCLNVMPGKVKL